MWTKVANSQLKKKNDTGNMTSDQQKILNSLFKNIDIKAGKYKWIVTFIILLMCHQ